MDDRLLTLSLIVGIHYIGHVDVMYYSETRMNWKLGTQ